MKTIGKGWIDLQVNGYQGVDFSASGLTVEAVLQVAETLGKRGIAGFCPTVISVREETLRENLPVLRRAIQEQNSGAQLLGIHLEGPFLNPACSGAHPKNCLRNPDLGALRRWCDWSGGQIVLHTLAPELPGAIELIKAISENGGPVICLGHHLANSETIVAARQAGAKACTHLGNGVPGTLDRHENPIIDQLVEDSLKLMFIPDGHHLPPNLLRLFLRARPVSDWIAVSDCAPIAGLPAGAYDLWQTRVHLGKNGCISKADGKSLAGSSLELAQCMRYLEALRILKREQLMDIGRNNALKLLNLF